MRSWLRFALSALACAVAAGCGPGDGGGDHDAGEDSGIRHCDEVADCDDDIECTKEACNAIHVCEYTPDNSVCSDGDFCNGTELCDLLEGCQLAPEDQCNDSDVCTLDSCDPEALQCTHEMRDVDGDGDPDFHCTGGGDCDDRDPLRASEIPEVCGDSIDNDCDDLIDEAHCGRPRFDSCEDPLDVTGGGTFNLQPIGALRDYDLSCALPGSRDVVFSFELEEAQGVDIRVTGGGANAVALFSECGADDTEIECGRGAASRVRIRSLPAGTYWGVIVANSTSEIVLDVHLSDPLPPPTNESCDMPQQILANGPVPGSFVDVIDDEDVSCLAGETPDLVYELTTEAKQDIHVSATNTDGIPLAVSIRTTCNDPETEKRCVRGSTADTRLYSAPANTYYLVVEAPIGGEPEFELEVELSPPTSPPAGDVCETAIPLTVGMTHGGTFTGSQDDHSIGCGLPYKDVVYSFTITDPHDVFVDLSIGGLFAYAAVQSDCGQIDTELLCTADADPALHLHNVQPGTYYLLLEAFSAASFDVTVSTGPPTVPVNVADNFTCEDAFSLPPTGGLFTGTTVGAGDDLSTAICLDASGPDAVFELNLAASQTVTISTEGSSFDTVVSLRQTSCDDGGEVSCDDSSGKSDTSRLVESLTAGDYFIVVDGFGGASGTYVLDVQVDP